MTAASVICILGLVDGLSWYSRSASHLLKKWAWEGAASLGLQEDRKEGNYGGGGKEGDREKSSHV